MKVKDKIITFIICSIILAIYLVIGSYNKLNNNAKMIYEVYLDGNIIGFIDNKELLLNLIDEKQQVIKDKYNVKNVYPPNGLHIVEKYSYKEKSSTIDEIYDKIEELQDFTIYGYEIQFSATKEHDKFSIYVLNKEVFSEAIKQFVLAFIDEDDYNNFINGTQKALEDVGINYQSMRMLEEISIREKYISVNDRIYTNSDELAQELLFGFNYKTKNYTVKEGDTIESISEAHSLNTQEFLIANPKFYSKDSLLTIGDVVNTTIINPEISFEYTVNEIKEVEKDFSTTIERDNTKPSSYSEIKVLGVKGLTIQTANYTVVNGEPNSNAEIINEVVVREVVDQVTVKGKAASAWFNWNDIGTGWRWPTGSPYTITSEFTWRWEKHHNGIDISGAKGLKIFAANDGVVVKVVTTCPNEGSYPNSCGSGYGNHVIIDHGNNIYTLYGHMLQDIVVSEGDNVFRGQHLGTMGNSGQSKGRHLHFAFSVGYPGRGQYKNPRELFK